MAGHEAESLSTYIAIASNHLISCNNNTVFEYSQTSNKKCLLIENSQRTPLHSACYFSASLERRRAGRQVDSADHGRLDV